MSNVATFFKQAWPKTMVVKMQGLRGPDDEIQTAQVWGGPKEDIWLATFADRCEAECFILASKHFGREVIGVDLGAAGKQGGAAPEAANESGEGSSGEVQGVSEGGAGSAPELPQEPVPVPGGDEVV